MSVIQLALKLVILIGVGYAARKLRVMPDGFDKMLSRFVMAIPLPCMIINSFQMEFSMEDLMNCPILLGLAVLTMFLSFALGQLVCRKLGGTSMAKSARFALVFTNFTFFGFAVVSELYGSQGLFYYVIFTLPIRILFYGGAPMLVGAAGEKPDLRETLKKFFCEPVIGVFIGFVLYVTQLPLPDVFSNVLSTLGNMASPLGLMLCGTIIADAQWADLKKYPCVLWVSLLRLTVLPAVMLGVFLLLRLQTDILRPLVFYFAMPVASFLPTFCLRYNPEETEGRVAGSYMVVVSTLLSILTVPGWALLLERIFAGS